MATKKKEVKTTTMVRALGDCTISKNGEGHKFRYKFTAGVPTEVKTEHLEILLKTGKVKEEK